MKLPFFKSPVTEDRPSSRTLAANVLRPMTRPQPLPLTPTHDTPSWQLAAYVSALVIATGALAYAEHALRKPQAIQKTATVTKPRPTASNITAKVPKLPVAPVKLSREQMLDWKDGHKPASCVNQTDPNSCGVILALPPQLQAELVAQENSVLALPNGSYSKINQAVARRDYILQNYAVAGKWDIQSLESAIKIQRRNPKDYIHHDGGQFCNFTYSTTTN